MSEPETSTAGTWIVENGVRRLVEAPTQDHPEGNRPRPAEESPQAPAAAAEAAEAKPRKGASK